MKQLISPTFRSRWNPTHIIVGLSFSVATLLFNGGIEANVNKDSKNFSKRFQLIRGQDGKLLAIRDRTLPMNFRIAPYLKMIQEDLISEQKLMKDLSLSSYEDHVLKNLEDLPLQTTENLASPKTQKEKLDQYVISSMLQLQKIDVENVFGNSTIKEIASIYENKMSDVLLKLDPTIIAVPSDPTHFYKKNVTYQVVKWGLDFAKKRLSSIPYLNTISYVMVQVEKLVTERRNFHQNMLLHYLEIFSPEELGLTKEEVDLVWSSIYESRIPWIGFLESDFAKNNWKKYGINKFYQNFRLGSDTLRTYGKIYTSMDERMNYAFSKVSVNNEVLAINLFDKEGAFTNRPAVAYNFSKPMEVKRKRIILSLAELGLSFLPINGNIKDQVSGFIKSYYEKQRITEGSLFGYLESMDLEADQKIFVKQYGNPFETALILE